MVDLWQRRREIWGFVRGELMTAWESYGVVFSTAVGFLSLFRCVCLAWMIDDWYSIVGE